MLLVEMSKMLQNLVLITVPAMAVMVWILVSRTPSPKGQARVPTPDVCPTCLRPW